MRNLYKIVSKTTIQVKKRHTTATYYVLFILIGFVLAADLKNEKTFYLELSKPAKTLSLLDASNDLASVNNGMLWKSTLQKKVLKAADSVLPVTRMYSHLNKVSAAYWKDSVLLGRALLK